ncbi:hypothetical protein LTR84_008749 [Exophiala bonariae]|uniref:Mid2 domain-containing protein n=1 Tax=Exophiala bonariae TaxID=1690606 RepID=A0AAV9MXG0_9EURO|nr:hypothetical protein LTR84_008749 [Exophiala bonariae]
MSSVSNINFRTWSFLASTCILYPLALADVSIISPRAGDKIFGLSLYISWEDSESAAPLADIASYQVFLCAGGNSKSSYIQLATLADHGNFSDGNTLSAPLVAGWGANLPNAYFLKFVSAAQGGTVINLSDRFSLSDMTGFFPQVVSNGLQSVASDAGPPDINNFIPMTISSVPGESTVASHETALLNTSTSSTNTTNIPASPTSSIPGQSGETSSPDSEPVSESISTGAKAGIIVGIVVLAIATITASVLCIRYRRVQRQHLRIRNENEANLPQGRVETKTSFLKPELEGSPGIARFEYVDKAELAVPMAGRIVVTTSPNSFGISSDASRPQAELSNTDVG